MGFRGRKGSEKGSSKGSTKGLSRRHSEGGKHAFL